MSPPFTTAIRCVPSDDDATDDQAFANAVSVHVEPLSVETKMSPPLTVAARCVPSDDDATDDQSCA